MASPKSPSAISKSGYVPMNLARSFLTAKNADVEFVSSEHSSFPAHSIVVENASKTLMSTPKKMGLFPKPSLPVKIQTPYRHDVIELFLEFLYLGKVNDFSPSEDVQMLVSSKIDHTAYDLGAWVEATFAAKTFDVPDFGAAVHKYLLRHICKLIRFSVDEAVDALKLVYGKCKEGQQVEIIPVLLKGIVQEFSLVQENQAFRRFAEENGNFSWDLSQAMNCYLATEE
ncbi:hypothetical protein Cpir12675_001495 [Ceratocystis pirilliformis]|uniref:BTB domain-containing protein n=1 Tax=Ceratocystis pirilliformis TaxID=259994 RepID=A0ABR3ZG69_9PEZI